MKPEFFSNEINLKDIRITDPFWARETELVRREVLPFQWDALNDRVADAAPSYCMHNFRAASALARQKRESGAAFVAPKYTFRGFEVLPEDPAKPEPDRFYGFVFQDSDFSKWIEAVAYSLTTHPDPQLEALADEAIELVCSAQLEDGYLDTYYILGGMDAAFTNLRDHHELYCFGHLTEGAVAYYQATGKDRLLKAACRFADCIDRHFGPEEGKKRGYPGHEIAEMALVRLYGVTGEEKYRRLSRFFLEERGRKPYYFETEEQHDSPTNESYHQSHLPVTEQKEAVGHAVRATYLYSGMADMARLDENETLMAACERLWDNIVQQKMYITGGIGGTHLGEAFSFNYDLPGDTAYAETCASIGMVFFCRRMLQLAPKAKYADVMELELYNGVLSGMGQDGKSFFYVNPLEVVPEACHKDERKFHVKPIRQKWFGCACCPPNIARLLGSVGSYAVTQNADTTWIHLYMGADITRSLEAGSLRLHMTSAFPWEGSVTIRVESERPLRHTLALRLPGWCRQEEMQLAVNGIHLEKSSAEAAFLRPELSETAASIHDGYLYLTADWFDQEITLNFPMKAEFLCANTRVRETRGQVALKRGPIVYCAEEADNGPDLHLLQPDISCSPIPCEVEIAGCKARALDLAGWREKADVEDAPLYHPAGVAKKEAVTIRMIPYFLWSNRGEGEMSVWLRR